MCQGILRVQRIRKPLYLCAFFSFTRFRYSSIAFSTNSDTDMSCSRAANFHCFTFSGGIERVSLPFNSSPPFCSSPSLYRYTYNMANVYPMVVLALVHVFTLDRIYVQEYNGRRSHQ